jgi:hypothetical protein
MLKTSRPNSWRKPGSSGLSRGTAVVADPAPARVAGRPESYADSGARPLSEVGDVHRPAPQRWPGDRLGTRLG